MTGPCELYYQSGILFFKGYLEEGYRQGRGTEYNEQGKVIFEGLNEKGVKLNKYPFRKMGEGYWKELDEKNQLRSVYQTDDKGKQNGICYFFKDGKISRVSEWQDGNEIKVLKEFTDDNTMIEYENGLKVYEGEFYNSLEDNYPRNGSGTEYDTDGKSILYKGIYIDNVPHEMGMGNKNRKLCSSEKEEWIMGPALKKSLVIQLMKIVILLVVLIICLLINYYFGIIISILMILYLCICWKCPDCCGCRIYKIIDNGFWNQMVSDMNASNNIENKSSSKSFKSKMKRVGKKLLKNINMLTNILIIIIVIVSTVNYIYTGPYGISFIQKAYVVEDNSQHNFLRFQLSSYHSLKYIIIGDRCFSRVKTFNINRLNQLISLRVGERSFTQAENVYDNDESKSFHILNCESLESIQIGKVESDSRNFY